MELEASHDAMRKRAQLWADERQHLTQTCPFRASHPKVSGEASTQPDLLGASATEIRLRDTLAKKDKLVMALRDAIKQLGVPHGLFIIRSDGVLVLCTSFSSCRIKVDSK